MTNNITKLFGAAMMIFALNACKKDNSAPTPVNSQNTAKHVNGVPATVSGFAPASGITFSAVTISGTNFSTTTTDNVVKINGVAAKVLSATTTQLTVTVPVGATTGSISVTTAGSTATSANTFQVLQSVKDATLGQTTPPVSDLTFDKNGNSYAIIKFAHYQLVVKNGSDIIYRTKTDTSTSFSSSSGDAGGTITKYSVVSVMNDTQGNTYVAVDKNLYSYSNFNPDSKGYVVTVYKIAAAGTTTVYIPSAAAYTYYELDADYNKDIQSLVMNNAGEIYAVDYGSSLIRKYNANYASEFDYTTPYSGGKAEKLAVGADGLLYASIVTNTQFQPYASNIIKINAQKQVTNLTTSNIQLTGMAVDVANNLFVARGGNLLIINAAGDANAFNAGTNINALTFDNLGRLDFVGDSGMARYIFK